LPSVTHARLRAEQGDTEGARFLARQVLALRPDDEEVKHLLTRLGAEEPAALRREPAGERGTPRERLEHWIACVRRNRGLGVRS